MRTLRRGMVAAALAVPLAFGTAGVASAHDGGVAWGAEYQAFFAAAGPNGAVVGGVSAEAGGVMWD
ncbi:hypothetical protein FHU38_000549 [Saccharomonospora amisosensis]|uniref:Uncharacterized protein n=1 Tax=Saccharomonospora amisosensis TaxID=1128677 RepID=A0A7X5ULI4_9PSEU|nr:hypothetical protein [Saccharomonospora amisosensis]NIJ10205.1 hypothetical protein [Saccharomonospora amisosensis]